MSILRIVIILFLIVGAGVGYAYYTGGAGLPPTLKKYFSSAQLPSGSSLSTITNQVSAIKVPKLPTDTTTQLESITERTGQLTSNVGKVLGTAVTEASSSADKSLQERAFDYGRYLYCQQVVKDYEARNKN